jgi:hypothetical protein
MRRAEIMMVGLLLGFATQPGHAADPGEDCRRAAVQSEQAERLPPGVLLAVGQIESGRLNIQTGQVDPWPWTTNLSGDGHYFASAGDAIAWVTARQNAGYRSIDVGCFQVNLMYHPEAFASVAEAFDPAVNARYAAALLAGLYERAGSWPLAVAWYHSADPAEGQRYSGRVMAAWDGGAVGTALPVSATVPGSAAPRTADPVVVRVAASALAVRVVLPGAPVSLIWLSGEQRRGLPRVFTPAR